MFYWPHLDLSDYEKRFVGPYKTAEKPGVLRRAYRVLMNNTEHPTVPGMESVQLTGSVQVSRASRVFGLTFSGDTNAWRLRISTASGTDFTPKLPGGTYPMVSTLSPGTEWNVAATNMAAPGNLTINAIATRQIAWMQHPLIIEPNWELDPNESLVFDGEAQNESALVLEICVHVWEFPGMVRGADGPVSTPRMGAGPSISGKGC